MMAVKMNDLVELVCERTGVSRNDLRLPTKERHVVEARALIYTLARKHTRLGWAAIARYSSGCDPSSARALYLRFMGRMDGELEAVLHELERGVGA